MSTSRTIVLISGGNSGIGLAVAAKLSQTPGFHVVIGSRNSSAGDKEAADLATQGGSVSSVQLDITSDESIKQAVNKIARDHGVLDVLINNAGVMLDYIAPGEDESQKLPTRDLFSQTFATNIIGAACLTEECLPLLRKSEHPRVIFVSTRMASLAEAKIKTNAWYTQDYRAYDCSKAALNMLALNYARILEDDGASVNVVCPGLVKTKLTRQHPYGTTTDVGARRIVELAIAPKGGPTATFTDQNGEIPW